MFMLIYNSLLTLQHSGNYFLYVFHIILELNKLSIGLLAFNVQYQAHFMTFSRKYSENKCSSFIEFWKLRFIYLILSVQGFVLSNNLHSPLLRSD